MIADSFNDRNEYDYVSNLINNKELIKNAEDAYMKKHKELEKENENIPTDIIDIRNILEKKTINIIKMLYSLNCRFCYINSGSTGHFFKIVVLNKNNEKVCCFGMKVTMYDKQGLKNTTIYDSSRPENVEIIISSLLQQIVKTNETPHIILSLGTYYTNIDAFLSLKYEGAHPNIKDNKNRYKNFIENAKKNKYFNKVSINFYEYANNGDFLNYIKHNYQKMKLIDWKIFFFQIISTLAIIQHHYPAFKHNDLKANNLLIHKIDYNNEYYEYTICNKKYKTPNNTYIIKLCDFDFASIDKLIVNKKVNLDWAKKHGITCKKNLYYDIHYFFNSLININFFPLILSNSQYTYKEVKDFINRVVPSKYRSKDFCNEHGRLIVDDEYMSPQGIIENDEFFKEFKLS